MCSAHFFCRRVRVVKYVRGRTVPQREELCGVEA